MKGERAKMKEVLVTIPQSRNTSRIRLSAAWYFADVDHLERVERGPAVQDVCVQSPALEVERKPEAERGARVIRAEDRAHRKNVESREPPTAPLVPDRDRKRSAKPSTEPY